MRLRCADCDLVTTVLPSIAVGDGPHRHSPVLTRPTLVLVSDVVNG